MRRVLSGSLFVVALGVASVPTPVFAQARRVSVTVDGAQANNHSNRPRASGDGLRVVFVSQATNLDGEADANGADDIYLWDNSGYATGRPPLVLRMSVSATGVAANGTSWDPGISQDGKWVAFASAASNLVAGDTNGTPDIYVRHVDGNVIYRASRAYNGNQPNLHCGSPSIANNGSVAFDCLAGNMVPGDTNGVMDVFLADADGRNVTRVSTGSAGEQATNGYSGRPSISADGMAVAFESYADGLAPGDTATSGNRAPDVFVKVLTNNHLHYASRGRGGTLGNAQSLHPSLSADGTYVVFESRADNLITDNAEYAADTDRTPGSRWTDDVFLHDIWRETTTRVSNGKLGAPLYGINATVSDLGHFVAYESGGHVHLWQLASRSGSRVSTRGAVDGDRDDHYGSVAPSRGSAIVVWASDATNLVDGDTNNRADIFFREVARTAATVAPATVISSGLPYQRSVVRVKGPHLGYWESLCRFCLFVPNALLQAEAPVSGVPSVTIGGQAATGVSVVSDDEIAFSTPHLAADSSSRVLISYADGEKVLLPVSLRAMIMPGPTVDVDGDALPDWWELTYGLDPIDKNDATAVQANGLTPAQSLAQQHHPTATGTRYLAEGATGALFLTRVALMNPGVLPATALLRYLKRDGTLVTQSVPVGPRSRATVDVETVSGMADAEFSTAIETDEALVVDRTMRWTPSGHYGSHAERSILAPAPTWYLAEGATHSGFDLFYLLQNPNASPAEVRVRYLLPSGANLEKTYTVQANSRANIWADFEQFPEGSGHLALADTDVSAVIDVLNGMPIIVERAMYLTRPGEFFAAGHESAGVTAPALTWSLAEGATGPYFDLFVLIANPNAQDAAITATYLLEGGATATRTYTVGANSRFNIWVDYEGGPLADAAVSTRIDVTNGIPVIVERAMWWPYGPTSWNEAHNSAGSTETGTRWGLAEGEVGGPDATDTYILIANTSTYAGQAIVTLLFEDGSSATHTQTLAPSSRTNVPVRETFGAAALDRRFGAVVESVPVGANPAAQIAVERAMYSSPGGLHWAAGTNALATRLQ